MELFPESHELAGRYRAVLELMSDAVVVRDASGCIVDINSKAQQLFDIDVDDVMGSSVPLPSWQGFRENGEPIPDSNSFGVQALETGRRHGGVVRFDVPGGNPKWFVVNASPLFGDDGSIIGVLKAMTDISRLREAEAKLVQQEARDYGVPPTPNVLSDLSHELRTPLNAVLGFSKLALARPSISVDEKGARYLGHVQDAAQHMLALINNLRDIGRVDDGQMPLLAAQVEMRPLVLEIVAWLQAPAAEAGVSVVVDTGGEDVLAQVDLLFIKQILLNLVSNAIKYNRAQGWVRICISSADGWCTVSVADSGYGMTADELEQLFIPYSRPTKEGTSADGTGLGLAISKKLIEAMGGELKVSSIKGEGTTFTLCVPAPSALA
jgi:PAS domain S-box-containing protein